MRSNNVGHGSPSRPIGGSKVESKVKTDISATGSTNNASENQPVEIIQGRLYWISDKTPPKSRQHAFYFCIDNDLVYEPFFADFGPLDLAKVHLFCKELEKLMSDSQYKSFKIYHYCSLDFAKQANAAFLMGCYMIIILKQSAD